MVNENPLGEESGLAARNVEDCLRPGLSHRLSWRKLCSDAHLCCSGWLQATEVCYMRSLS
jgi:hypothetical protein